MVRVEKLVNAVLKLSDIEEYFGELYLIADFVKAVFIVLGIPAIACHFLDQVFQ